MGFVLSKHFLIEAHSTNDIMDIRKYWNQLKGWLLITLMVGFLGLLVWWLVYLNTHPDKTTQERLDQKGEITEGLINGKDYGTDYTENEKAEFEALVVLRDQIASDPEEDRRSSLKRGDVIAVRKLPHLWSDTERVSYLIVKIKMTGKEANSLLAPKIEGDTIVLARAQRIDVDALGVTGSQVVSGQPFAGKVFDSKVIQGK